MKMSSQLGSGNLRARCAKAMLDDRRAHLNASRGKSSVLLTPLQSLRRAKEESVSPPHKRLVVTRATQRSIIASAARSRAVKCTAVERRQTERYCFENRRRGVAESRRRGVAEGRQRGVAEGEGRQRGFPEVPPRGACDSGGGRGDVFGSSNNEYDETDSSQLRDGVIRTASSTFNYRHFSMVDNFRKDEASTEMEEERGELEEGEITEDGDSGTEMSGHNESHEEVNYWEHCDEAEEQSGQEEESMEQEEEEESMEQEEDEQVPAGGPKPKRTVDFTSAESTVRLVGLKKKDFWEIFLDISLREYYLHKNIFRLTGCRDVRERTATPAPPRRLAAPAADEH